MHVSDISQSDLSRAVISLAIASDYTYLVYLVSLCSRDVMALNNYIQPQCLFCLLRALDKVGNHFCLPSQVYLSVGKVLQHQVDSSTSALNHFHLLSHSSQYFIPAFSGQNFEPSSRQSQSGTKFIDWKLRKMHINSLSSSLSELYSHHLGALLLA